MGWLPLIISIAVLYVLRRKKKRIIIPLVILLYILLSITTAILPSFIGMTNSGQADPQLIAGQISESLVTALLRVIVDLPILGLLLWLFKRQKHPSK
ncbi:MAG: hypothetical protein ABJ275_07975 [Maricaulaceae bacterium]